MIGTRTQEEKRRDRGDNDTDNKKRQPCFRDHTVSMPLVCILQNGEFVVRH
jgi:hypothetical protein